MTSGDTAVLFHGILLSSWHLRKLAAYLENQGYSVLNIPYPSTRYTLEELEEIAWRKIAPQLPQGKPTHFVGFSMGGLLVRAILARHRPPTLGRVVQLAPPNHGSEVADLLKNNWFYRKLYGPAGQQLCTTSDIGHLFGPMDYELGVLAGNRPVDLISSRIIGRENDGKVSLESTKLEGMRDHLVLPASHTFFPYNKQVHAQAVYFLRHGQFLREHFL